MTEKTLREKGAEVRSALMGPAYAGALEAESVPPGSRYAELGDRPLCLFTGNCTVLVDAW